MSGCEETGKVGWCVGIVNTGDVFEMLNIVFAFYWVELNNDDNANTVS